MRSSLSVEQRYTHKAVENILYIQDRFAIYKQRVTHSKKESQDEIEFLFKRSQGKYQAVQEKQRLGSNVLFCKEKYWPNSMQSRKQIQSLKIRSVLRRGWEQTVWVIVRWLIFVVIMRRQADYESLQTVRRIGELKAIGSVFCDGMSNKYQARAPPLLSDILTPQQVQRFVSYVEQLNFKTSQYWPCLFAYLCGHICVPCTAGLSLCLPRLCVAEAENVLRQEIRKINRDILSPRKLQMKLVKGCYSSHLLIEQVDFAHFEGAEIEL